MNILHPAVAALLAAAVICQTQIPIPPHSSVYNGYSRGFNYTSPTSHIIAGLDLPPDAFLAGDTAGYLVRVNGAVALHSIGNVGAITTAILVNVGDVVDVIGNWSPAVPGSFTAHNSYGSTAPYASSINGVPVTLNRTGWQWDIGDPLYAGSYLAPGTGSIGRVLVTTTPQAGLYANFTSDVQTGPSPLIVNFTDTSFTSDPGGVLAWAWDFENDGTIDSTVQHPTFVYANCGTYSVALTVVDASHAPSTLVKTAFITTDAVVASFTDQLVAPLVVQFTDTSIGSPTSWAWDLDGDGTVDTTVQHPAWVYANANPVNVTLTASRLCGLPSTITKTIVPLQQITSGLVSNNGNGNYGSVMLDLDVLNPQGLSITSLDVYAYTVVQTCNLDMYVRRGTYNSFWSNPAEWVLVGTATGTSSGATTTPFNLVFSAPVYLPPGLSGVKFHYRDFYCRYTTGTAVQTFGNADVTMTLGTAQYTTATNAFTGSTLTPRWFAGTIYYGTHNIGGQAGYGSFAPGCAGSLGVSHLTHNLPQLGTTLNLTVTNLPLSSCVMITGFSNAMSRFGPLPFDLSPYGAPGCTARVSDDAPLFLMGAGNSATWNFAIPNVPAISGLLLYNQALVLDPGFNGLNAVMSDAAAMLIGI